MLLPSAISCDQGISQVKPQRPLRPKLPSFERYEPCRRPQSPVIGLIASCRALQSMLGERFSSSPLPSPPLDTVRYANPLASPFGEPAPPLPSRQPAPRGQNKRSRPCLEEDEEDVEQKDPVYTASSRAKFATPKRRRVAPADLPPGLQVSDFESLTDTEMAYAPRQTCKTEIRQVDIPTYEQEMHNTGEIWQPFNDWTENDDRLLVETVLSKLNLSTREWNDCASRLGKDKDSLGHRWRLLLGEGNVGLRRGAGRTSRVDLDIKSW